MATNFFIHKSGRWLQLDLEEAAINGIREKPRFLYLSKGTLQVIPTSLILRGLQAFQSGQKSCVRAGLTLLKHRKRKRHRRRKHRTSFNHCCRCDHGKAHSCIQPSILTTNVTSISDAVTQTNSHNPPQFAPGVKNDIREEYKALQIQPRSDNNRVNAENKSTESESDTPCKELYIDIQDIGCIKSVLARNPQFLGPFDENMFNKNATYRNVILFQLNPLVKIERVRNLERLLGNNDLSLVEFAALLGLTHVTDKKTINYAYKTRQKVNEANDNDRQMKQLKKQTLSISSDDEKENEQNKELLKCNGEKSLKPQVATTRAERDKKYMKSSVLARGKKGRFLKKNITNVKDNSDDSNGNVISQKMLVNKASNNNSSDTDDDYVNVNKKVIKKVINSESSDSEYPRVSKYYRKTMKEDAAMEARVTRRSLVNTEVKNVVNDKEDMTGRLKTVKKLNEKISKNMKNADRKSSSSDEGQLNLKKWPKTDNKRKGNNDDTGSSSSDQSESSISDDSVVNPKRQSTRLLEVAKSKVIEVSTDSEEKSGNPKREINIKATNNNGNETKSTKRPFNNIHASDSEAEFVTTKKHTSKSQSNNNVVDKAKTRSLLNNADQKTQGRNNVTDKRATNNMKKLKLNEDRSKKGSKRDSDSSDRDKEKVIRSSKRLSETITGQDKNSIPIKTDTMTKPSSQKSSSSQGSTNSLKTFKKKIASLASKKLGIKNKTRFKPMKPPVQKGAACYTSLEDHAIISWVNVGARARSVNGNRIWQELQGDYERITGCKRTWHSLRNRYLRYILPSLGALCVDPKLQSHLRAAAARGNIKLARKRPLDNQNVQNSILKLSPVISASSRRPRPARSLDLGAGTGGKTDDRSKTRDKVASPLKSPVAKPRSPNKSPQKLRTLRSSTNVNSPTYSDLTKRFVDKRGSGQLSREPTPPPPEEKSSRARRLYNPKAI